MMTARTRLAQEWNLWELWNVLYRLSPDGIPSRCGRPNYLSLLVVQTFVSLHTYTVK